MPGTSLPLRVVIANLNPTQVDKELAWMTVPPPTGEVANPGGDQSGHEFSRPPTPSEVDAWVEDLVEAAREPQPEPELQADGPVAAEHCPVQQEQAQDAAPDDNDVPDELCTTTERGIRDSVAFQKILGEELRALRRRRGWTRKQLRRRLPSAIGVQTIATYEQGIRKLSVLGLVELCDAMNEPPQDLLARVHQRATPASNAIFSDGIHLELSTLAALDDPQLVPLRRWAEQRMHQSDANTDVHLDLVALRRMAELCHLPLVDLVGQLWDLRA